MDGGKSKATCTVSVDFSEMAAFFEKYKFSKLNQEEKENTSKSVIAKEPNTFFFRRKKVFPQRYYPVSYAFSAATFKTVMHWLLLCQLATSRVIWERGLSIKKLLL